MRGDAKYFYGLYQFVVHSPSTGERFYLPAILWHKHVEHFFTAVQLNLFMFRDWNVFSFAFIVLGREGRNPTRHIHGIRALQLPTYGELYK